MAIVTFGQSEDRVGALIDTASASRTGIDNGQPGLASVVEPLERSCHLLAARRPVSAGGGCRLLSGATDITLPAKIPREPYARRLRFNVLCSLTGASGSDDYVRVRITTDTDATGVSTRVRNQTATGFADARWVQLEVDCGDGTNANLGIEDVNVTFVRSNDGTVRVFSWSFQPFPLLQIEV
jgi:hypothetical protein